MNLIDIIKQKNPNFEQFTPAVQDKIHAIVKAYEQAGKNGYRQLPSAWWPCDKDQLNIEIIGDDVVLGVGLGGDEPRHLLGLYDYGVDYLHHLPFANKLGNLPEYAKDFISCAVQDGELLPYNQIPAYNSRDFDVLFYYLNYGISDYLMEPASPQADIDLMYRAKELIWQVYINWNMPQIVALFRNKKFAYAFDQYDFVDSAEFSDLFNVAFQNMDEPKESGVADLDYDLDDDDCLKLVEIIEQKLPDYSYWLDAFDTTNEDKTVSGYPHHACQLVPIAKVWIAEKGRCAYYFLGEAFFEVDKIAQNTSINGIDKINLEIVLAAKILEKLNIEWTYGFGKAIKPLLVDLYRYDEWKNEINLKITTRNALFNMITGFVVVDDDINEFENEIWRSFSGCYQNQRFENIFQLHDLVCA
ncbi:hypothetical protein ACFBZI_11690 [Moraxella sp. ZJ142]|uniref:hypothetical protein n=1 Tax=Moraxella marmotae TaxID=3344520 RepID=UPI0035D4823F